MMARTKHRSKKQHKKAAPKPEKVQVDPTKLKWKRVEIGDALDDFGGFYGLEEIDGVDVKIVDGKATFFTTEDHIRHGVSSQSSSSGSKEETTEEGPAIAEDQEENQSDDDEEEEDISDAYKEGDLIEFKNLDDYKEGELSALSDSEDEESEEVEGEGEGDIGDEGDETELKPNIFSAAAQLEDIQSLVNLPEWDKVAKLSSTTLRGLSDLGFVHPTEIQKKIIPLALEDKDIMGKAPTGSGKTLAFGIPILEKLLKNNTAGDVGKGNSPVGLIFTPTRELAQQVMQHISAVLKATLTERTKHLIMSLTGGLSIQKQERLLTFEGSARIVVATPGRFLELLEKDDSLITRFCRTDILVLDEADRLLQDGHFDEFEKILKLLGSRRKSVRKNDPYWQTMIFSATFSLDLFRNLSTSGPSGRLKANNQIADDSTELQAVLKHLMAKVHFRSKPVIVDTDPDHKVSSQIKEALIECAPLERDLYVYYFVTMFPGTTLVFCNSIDSVKKLHAFLNLLKVQAFEIHSSMTQKNRLKNLEKFKEQAEYNSKVGKATVLIASDVAARGLDIPLIQHVIHYHLPRSADIYIHRSGRAARASNEGVSVMLCSPQESTGPLRKLRRLLLVNTDGFDPKGKKYRNGRGRNGGGSGIKWQKTVPLLPIEYGIISQLRDRSEIASKLADHEIATHSLNRDENWLKKAAEDLGIDVDSDDEQRDVHLAKNKKKKQGKTMDKAEVKYAKAELNELLATPLRKDMRKKYLTGGLVNLADSLVKKRGHQAIIGESSTAALDVLKQKKRKRQRGD